MSMTQDQAMALIKSALDKTKEGLSGKVSPEVDLIKDKIIDSLDSMNFLFELEQLVGKQLDAIDETFDDFRVSRLLEILQEVA